MVGAVLQIISNQVAVYPCNADGTMMGDEDDDPFVEDPSELVSCAEKVHVDHQIL